MQQEELRVFVTPKDGTSLSCDEISLLAKPKALRTLGEFLLKAAEEMEGNAAEHLHFQDYLPNFSYEHYADVIVLNADKIKLKETVE